MQDPADPDDAAGRRRRRRHPVGAREHARSWWVSAEERDTRADAADRQAEDRDAAARARDDAAERLLQDARAREELATGGYAR